MKRLVALLCFSLVTLAFVAILQSTPSFSTTPLQLLRRSRLLAHLLVRRQGDHAKTSTAISIAPSQYWDGNDGPWSSFPLQVGTGAVGGLQDVRVMPSTAGTAIFTIAAQGCPPDYVMDCPNSRGGLFLTNESLTWSPNSLYQTGLDANLGLDSSGFAGFDVATLGWQGSTTVTDEHSVIWNLADSKYWIGVFGLNPRPTNFTTFSDPQRGFMQSLFDRNVLPSLTYGYTAGNQYRLDQVFGSLTLGGYDANRFVPNNVSFSFYPDISRDLSVNLQSITTEKGSPSNLLPDGSISIFIDSTVAEIWLPESACAAFEQAFGIKYNTDFDRYLITGAQRKELLNLNAQITFKIGPHVSGGESVDITLPYQAFDLQVSFPIVENPNTSYYFPLQKAANDTQYTLGRTFLQEAYLIADYERQNFSVSQCDWKQNLVNNQDIVTIKSPDATTKASLSHSATVIVGVVIATVGVISIVGLILLFVRRKRSKEKQRLADLAAEEAEKVESANSNRPFISRPFGGELGSSDLHEMEPSSRLPAAEMDSPYRADPNNHGYNEMEAGGDFAQKDYPQIYELPGSDVYELPTQRRSVLPHRSYF